MNQSIKILANVVEIAYDTLRIKDEDVLNNIEIIIEMIKIKLSEF